MTNKTLFAIEIGEKIKEQFKTKQETFNSKRCCTCGQKIPNPYTQLWLAEQIDVSKATLCHILQGNRLPTLEQIVKLSIVLDCTIDSLLIDMRTFLSVQMLQNI